MTDRFFLSFLIVITFEVQQQRAALLQLAAKCSKDKKERKNVIMADPLFQEYEEPVYSYSTHPVRRSPRDIHNILKLSPPFASSEGVGSDRYQSDSAHRTQPTP